MLLWNRGHQMQSLIPLRAHSFTYCLFLFSSYNSELSICDRNLAHEVINIYYLDLTDPCFRVSTNEYGECGILPFQSCSTTDSCSRLCLIATHGLLPLDHWLPTDFYFRPCAVISATCIIGPICKFLLDVKKVVAYMCCTYNIFYHIEIHPIAQKYFSLSFSHYSLLVFT